MTARAELQIGKLFRDLDGSLVHLKGIRNEICIWTADIPTSDGAMGGATHMENFRRRFMPVPEAQPEVFVTDFTFLASQPAGEIPVSQHA